MARSLQSFSSAILAGVVALGAGLQPAAALETKSFVVRWFVQAIDAHDDDCPHGLNPAQFELHRRSFVDLGYSKDDALRMATEIIGQDNGGTYQQMLVNRGRLDGKLVNAFKNPWTAPDPHIYTSEGKYALGFNLDGDAKTGFEDPETHEKGVDNQLYRALGCLIPFHVHYPDAASIDQNGWEHALQTMPAWVISITGDDLSKDGDVKVVYARALKSPMRDGNGDLMADQTLRIDPSSRSYNVFKGHLKSGTITVEPARFYMEAGEMMIAHEYLLENAHMRLKIKNGALEGYVGGYMPWYPLYWMLSSEGVGTAQEDQGQDIPGTYYALKKMADSNPDSKTGQNMSISSTYRIVASSVIAIDPHEQRGQQKTVDAVLPNGAVK